MAYTTWCNPKIGPSSQAQSPDKIELPASAPGARSSLGLNRLHLTLVIPKATLELIPLDLVLFGFTVIQVKRYEWFGSYAYETTPAGGPFK
jgi:hypothetical protein